MKCPQPRPLRSLLARTAFAFLALGCAKTPQITAVAPSDVSNAPATAIEDDDFSRQAHLLLLSTNRDLPNKLLLAGVVQYQLTRADKLFRAGHTQQAEDVVIGALLLLRHDDELLSATRGQGSALLEAAHAAARSGDAGRAQSLYELTRMVSEDPTILKDVDEHIAALKTWNHSTRGATTLEQIGEKTRRSLSRSVVDPRADAYLTARDDIIAWITAALTSSAGERDPTSRAERDLAMEAYKAIRTGAPAMIALNLRQGTPAAAITALENAELDRALPPAVRALLEETTSKNNPEAWLELFRQLDGIRKAGGTETQLPKYVSDGATLWAAIGLYRSSPGVIEHAMPLGMTLVEFGMPEVASSLLAQNTNQETSPEALAWCLSLVSRGLIELSGTDQLNAARRSYSEASPLLVLADKQSNAVGAARARFLMASLEARHGFVEQALPLLEASLGQEPSAEVLLRLARLQSQQGQKQEARLHLDWAIRQAQKSGNLLAESQAEEALFRSLRQSGESNEAKKALDRSLKRIIVRKNMQVSPRHAASLERQLARVLEYYGDDQVVRKAYARALEASRPDPAELEMTLTDMARSALTSGDVRLGRLATQSALDFGLPAENSVYIALWGQLLEKRTHSKRHGANQEVLTRAKHTNRWIASLRKWGLGELPSSELKKHAQGIPEQVESDFYGSLNGTRIDKKLLAQVARSPATELIEVKIAQDLIFDKKKRPLPQDITLP